MATQTRGRSVPEQNGKADDVPTSATHASQWRKESKEGVLYTLPGSGHVMRLRRPGLQGMVTRVGHIPNPLSREVLKFLAELGEMRGVTDEDDNAKSKRLQESSEAAVHLMQICAVDPKVVTGRDADYDNGEIAADDIPDFDYNWLVYSFLEGDAARLKEFRVDTSNGASRLSSDTVRPNTDTSSIP